MIISDIDYLEPITETSATHLIGSSGALAIADSFAFTYGTSTLTNTVFKNKAVSRPNGSAASSYVNLTASSPNGVAIASASASAGISSK